MSIKNKKAQMLIGIIGAVIVGIILLFLVSKGVSGGTMDSLTPKTPDCKVSDTNVRIKGTADVRDDAILGVKAITHELKINEIRNVNTGGLLSGFPLKGFTSQDYKWKVEIINTRTNNAEASDGGSNNHLGGNTIQENPYTLDFKVPENNCDGVIDDFDGKLVFSVITDDNEKSEIKKDLTFRNGAFRR